MKKLIVILILLPLCSVAQEEIKKRSTFLLSAHLGGNVTQYIKTESSDQRASLWPFVGMSVKKNFNKYIGLNTNLQYSYRGSDSRSPSFKYINSSIDLQLTACFQPFKGLTIIAGPAYSQTITAKKHFSGLDKPVPRSYPGYRFEFVGGIDVAITELIDLRIYYTNDFSTLKYNFQFAINVKLNKIKLKTQYQKYTDLEAALSQPLSVRKLVLHRQKIDVLPKEVGNMLNLETLVLDGNNLTELPKEIGNLVNLEKLSVRFNKLTSLPSEISNLTNLNEMNIQNNRITRLPEGLFNLKKLNYLYIGKNSLEELSPSIGNLTTLIELDVASCGPSIEIPSTIIKLRGLEVLYYDSNILLPSIGQINKRVRLIRRN